MADKRADRNFQRGSREARDDENRRYHTPGYYDANRELSESRDRRPLHVDDDQGYDEFNTGKQEDYKAEGYYGSNYGAINELNRGRDFERNAGYREVWPTMATTG